MVMNATNLSNEIIAALGLPAGDTAARAAWLTVAQTLITHITTNAVVTTTGGNGTIA